MESLPTWQLQHASARAAGHAVPSTPISTPTGTASTGRAAEQRRQRVEGEEEEGEGAQGHA